MTGARVPVALTIAGSDSGGGAGLQGDLKTFAAHGVHGASVVTAVTAQSSRGVAGVVVLPPAFVETQIETIVKDMDVGAVKTGMLGSVEVAAAVGRALRALGRPLVVDPVMASTGGAPLLAGDAARAYWDHLLPLATLVTPNLPEAEALLGRRIETPAEIREAAEQLVARGVRAVVVKGGHRTGDAIDVFFDGREIVELAAPRVDTPHTHGTGCAFSAAIAARLARGEALLAAVRAAKIFVTAAIERGYAVGQGRGVLDHLHPLRVRD